MQNDEKVIAYPANFGLADDQPLTIEGVIKACFANPDRAKYPEFNKRSGIGYVEYKDSLTEEELLEMVNTKAAKGAKKFTDTQIQVHDVEGFYKVATNFLGIEEPGETVDPSAYLETIKNSRWHGPFGRFGGYDGEYVFFTIDNTGQNEYHLSLRISLPFEYIDESFWLDFKKNALKIREVLLVN